MYIFFFFYKSSVPTLENVCSSNSVGLESFFFKLYIITTRTIRVYSFSRKFSNFSKGMLRSDEDAGRECSLTFVIRLVYECRVSTVPRFREFY